VVESQAVDRLGVVALDQDLVEAELVGLASIVVRQLPRRLVVHDLEPAGRRPVDAVDVAMDRDAVPARLEVLLHGDRERTVPDQERVVPQEQLAAERPVARFLFR